MDIFQHVFRFNVRVILVVGAVSLDVGFLALCDLECCFGSIKSLRFLYSSSNFLNASSNTLLFASAVVISSSKLVFVISASFKSFESSVFSNR